MRGNNLPVSQPLKHLFGQQTLFGRCISSSSSSTSSLSSSSSPSSLSTSSTSTSKSSSSFHHHCDWDCHCHCHCHCHHNHHHHQHHHHHSGCLCDSRGKQQKWKSLQCSWKYCNSKKSFTSSRKGGNLRHCNVKHKPVERNRIQEIQIFDKYLIFCVFVPFHIQNSLYKVPKWVGLKILLPKHPWKSRIGA